MLDLKAVDIYPDLETKISTTGTRRLRVLLSAYACEPGKGSEPGVGWNWALTLPQRGHDVWVITRSNNRVAIERGLASQSDAIVANLHFIYYDLPTSATWWKKGNRGVHLYYLLWQWGAYLVARQEHAKLRFELVQHVTFVSARQPSFMGNLGIPFIFGPVAGGEKSPWRLRLGFGIRGFVKDTIRDLANLLVRFDPLMLRTFAQADKIYVTSEQTRDLIPTRYRQKSSVQLAIASDKASNAEVKVVGSDAHHLRVLYVGQFLYWKGMHLGLEAFAGLLKAHPTARLTLVGKGPDEKHWRRITNELQIDPQVNWIPWVARAELGKLYTDHNVFLFPSLHDSGGMVVLEAMAHGLPVVCLKLGGPGEMVNAATGIVIDPMNDPVAGLTKGLLQLATDPELRTRLGLNARAQTLDATWEKVVANVYQPIEQASNGVHQSESCPGCGH